MEIADSCEIPENEENLVLPKDLLKNADAYEEIIDEEEELFNDYESVSHGY